MNNSPYNKFQETWPQTKEKPYWTNHNESHPKSKTIEKTPNYNDWSDEEYLRWKLTEVTETENYYMNLRKKIKTLKGEGAGPILLKKLRQRKHGLLGILVEWEPDYLSSLGKGDSTLAKLKISSEPCKPIMRTTLPASKRSLPEKEESERPWKNPRMEAILASIPPVTKSSVMKDYLPQTTTQKTTTTSLQPQKENVVIDCVRVTDHPSDAQYTELKTYNDQVEDEQESFLFNDE
jgi:hypothetical protein